MSASGAERETSLDIAIIGMSGRFPGAADVDAFWRNLCAGVESVERLRREDLLAAGVDVALLDGGGYVPARGLLEGIDRFDAAFFGYTPSEAAALDPQHRLFLECAWEAFEHAGYEPTQAGVVGVYAGSSANGYLAQALENPGLVQSPAELAVLLGTDKDFLTTRVSYKLNLKGPSVAVQTACSTSLVAVHLACQALLNGECDLALAGGVSIGVPQHVGHLYQEGGIGSPDGHCRAFDADARGTVAGSGVGVVLLARLEDAERRGDPIVAVIKGSAINNDGHQKVGFTAPAIEGQVRVIRAAHAAANVGPDSISYVEAHGTGTPLGDPIEVSALTEAFGGAPARRAPCGLGSVKTNVGHLDAAAGITGLIKVAQALRHRQLPPSLHFKAPNPAIDFERSPFRVVRELTPWTAEAPLRAAVSSFGLGGTNAHVVLEEAPVRDRRNAVRRAASATALGERERADDELIVLSARSERGLEALSGALVDRLAAEPVELASVAHTLQIGRRAFAHRRAVVARTPSDAERRLREAPQVSEPCRERAVVFLFPGQGVLRPNQCRELYETVPSFAADIDRCAELLAPHLALDVRSLLLPAEREVQAAERRVLETELGQPCLFVVEYALARLWLSLGVQPDAALGHSLGEWVCACLGGTCRLEDALALMVVRGRLMQAAPAGGMLAVAAGEARLAPWTGGEVSLAAVNAPNQCVLSGPTAALASVARALSSAGIAARPLPTSRAFHSPLVADAAQRFAAAVARVRLAPPERRWISNVTGAWISDAEATSPEYWAAQLRETVRFAAGLGVLLEHFAERAPLLLEVGPGETLVQLCRQTLAHATRAGSRPAANAALPVASLGQRHGGDRAAWLSSVGDVWQAGVPVDFAPLWRERDVPRVHLPTTPFERQSYWLPPPRAMRSAAANSAPAEVPPLADWFYVPSWQRRPLLEAGKAAAPAEWFLIAERGGPEDERLLAGIASGLELGARVTRVESVEGFAELSKRGGEGAAGVLYASALLPASEGSGAPSAGVTALPSVEAFVAAQERGALGVIRVLQALGAAQRPARLVVLATGLCDVTGDETLRPEHAPLLGVCRTVSKEYPAIDCRVIDLPAGAGLDSPAERLASQVVLEALWGPVCDDPVVAHRGAHRWVATTTPIRLERAFSAEARDTETQQLPLDGGAAAAPPPVADDASHAPVRTERLPLRERGVYLITGGLGGVGSSIAEWLAARARARLVLVGRSARSAEPALLDRIVRAGGEVEACAADVADPEQLRAALRAAEARFGVLHGVIHAAGLDGGGVIQRLTPELFMAELRAKALGALRLEEVLGGRELDFVVYCSSLTALSGGVGQAGYAAANASLDALAQSAARRGRTRTLSVNFDRWHGVGMAARSAERLRNAGLGGAEWQGMSRSEGCEALGRLLRDALQLPQALVSRRALAGMPRDESFGAATPVAAGSETRSAAWSGARATPGGELSLEALVARVGEIWAAVLGVPSVDPDQSFFEQGGESLLALSILNRVRAAFGTELSLRDFFASPSVRGLAAQLARTSPQQGAASSASAESRLEGAAEPRAATEPSAGAVAQAVNVGSAGVASSDSAEPRASGGQGGRSEEPVLRALPRTPRRYAPSKPGAGEPRGGDQ